MEAPVFPYQQTRHGDMQALRAWQSKGGNIGEPLLPPVAETWTRLMLACAEGDVRLVRAIIETGGARPSTAISTKVLASSTPLHVASRYGHAGVVGALLELGAAVDARDTLGLTPLMLAAGHGHLGTMDVLLEAGADYSSSPSALEAPGGATALDMATMAGYDDAAALLKSRAAAGQARDRAGKRKALASWLGVLGCEDFLGRFLRAGYDDLEFMASQGMTEEDLDCVGVPREKLGLRKKLLAMHGVERFLSVESGSGASNADADGEGASESESESSAGGSSGDEGSGGSDGDESDEEQGASGSDDGPRVSDDETSSDSDGASGSGSDADA
ncbi:unnamed protein product [Scytosiphon promiscuus]